MTSTSTRDSIPTLIAEGRDGFIRRELEDGYLTDVAIRRAHTRSALGYATTLEALDIRRLAFRAMAALNAETYPDGHPQRGRIVGPYVSDAVRYVLPEGSSSGDYTAVLEFAMMLNVASRF